VADRGATGVNSINGAFTQSVTMALKFLRHSFFVPKPPNISFGEAMRRLRIWLDYRKLQPASVRITSSGPIGFEIVFLSERDADEFEDFGWPLA
jgi:hypothetical protein